MIFCNLSVLVLYLIFLFVQNLGEKEGDYLNVPPKRFPTSMTLHSDVIVDLGEG